MFPKYVTGDVLDARVILILAEKFPYYKKLSLKQQEVFRKRLHEFLAKKKFVPRKNFSLQDEMRVLIAACAIQVTFGLDNYMLGYFEYILVYPDVYRNPHTRKMHKGETNLAGFMCLSWKDIESGIKREEDNYNLGLHEFAHALRFNSFKGNQENDYFFEGYFPKVIAIGEPEFYKLKTGKPSIFRKYGGTNINEFYAVLIEHWFESPEQFKQELPELYRHMCILMNQDIAGGKVLTQVREKYLQNSVPILSNVLGAATGYGGVKLILLVLSVLIYVTVENISHNGRLDGTWYFVFLVFCLLTLIVLPRAKKILIFEEGVLLSWLAQGVFRKDPLYLLNDNLVTVEFIEDREGEDATRSKTMIIHYHYNMNFRSIELACNFTLKQVRVLIRHFRSRRINVVLHGYSRIRN